MTFEQTLILFGMFLAAGYLLGEYGHWTERIKQRRRRRLIERLGRERAPW